MFLLLCRIQANQNNTFTIYCATDVYLVFAYHCTSPCAYVIYL